MQKVQKNAGRRDYYKILGVPRNAGEDVINKVREEDNCARGAMVPLLLFFFSSFVFFQPLITIYSHIHTVRTHSYTLSPFFLSRSLALSLSHNLSISLPRSHIISLSHTHTLTLSLIRHIASWRESGTRTSLPTSSRRSRLRRSLWTLQQRRRCSQTQRKGSSLTMGWIH